MNNIPESAVDHSAGKKVALILVPFDSDTHPLDRESLDRIVRSVNAWYDAFYATVVV